ncbi:MAG TPA: Rieske (2Fe-2S) protein [Myxococcales bacterium]|nr:Rieske (2Fe-2S) protein [Myxococcales bacterium]HET9753592.1 Rieske (2Fe-2S) protein [Myxococcales bacterium]
MSPSGEKTPRRTVLDVLLGAGVLGWLGSVIFPILRYLKPLGAQAQNGPIKLTAEEQAKLEKERSVIVRAGSARIIVLDVEKGLTALSAKCTHEGCTVQYVPGESLIWCACHNGRFDFTGRVLSGPPPRPLAKYAAQREADGSVIVQLGRGPEAA